MQKEIFNLIASISGQANILTIPRIFIDYTGDIESALFLSQLLYWTGKTSDGWVYKTYAQWNDEICIKEKKLRSIKDKLELSGILKTQIKRVAGVTIVHYQVQQQRFIETIIDKYKEKGAPEQPKEEDRNGHFEGSGTDNQGVPTITEITGRDYKQILWASSNKNALMIIKIIKYLNEQAGKNYETGEGEKAPAKAYIKAISARLKEKRQEEDFKKIIDLKVSQWGNDSKMNPYLNPETLFRDSNFDKYLEQATAAARKEKEEAKTTASVLDRIFQEGRC